MTCSVTFVRQDLWHRHLRVSHEKDGQEPLVDSATRGLSDTIVQDISNTHPHGSTINPSSWAFPNSASSPDQSSRDVLLQSPTTQNPPSEVAGGYDEGPGMYLSMPQNPDELWGMAFEEPWIKELEEWRSDFCTHQSTRFTNSDMQWFFDSQQPLELEQEGRLEQMGQHFEPFNAVTPLRDTATITAEIYNINGDLPPIYMQELHSKLYVAKTGEFEPPSCGFRVCNALTDERRIELLMDLRNIMDVDIRDPIFSLNSMKQGIHLFCRNVNIEYAFIHHELICSSSRDNLQAVVDVFGEEAGPQLIWMIITLGWTLMRSDNKHEYHMSSKIQRAIRTSIINVMSSSPLAESANF